jgi:hypothetical protein
MISMCVCVFLLIVSRQRLGKHIPAVTNTHATVEELKSINFWDITRYIPEVDILHNHRSKNLKSYTVEELYEASFSVRFVSYQKKVGNYFFPELLVVY